MSELIVNGKHYPLWSQFVERKAEWIGGKLQDAGDRMDAMLGLSDGWSETEITDINLETNGKTSAAFMVTGKDFSCGGDVGHLGVVGGAEGWLTLSGYGGHTWRIKRKES